MFVKISQRNFLVKLVCFTVLDYIMPLKKRPRFDPSYASASSGSNSSFRECFRSLGEREWFDRVFITRLVNTSRTLNVDCL